MKSAVSVALIVCGALMVAVPPAYQYLIARASAQLMASRSDVNATTLAEPLAAYYWSGTFLLGAAMILVAVVGAFNSRNPCN